MKKELEESSSENSIYESQSIKQDSSIIELDENLKSKNIEVVNIYDPEDNSLTIDMWSNTDGNKILDVQKSEN